MNFDFVAIFLPKNPSEMKQESSEQEDTIKQHLIY